MSFAALGPCSSRAARRFRLAAVFGVGLLWANCAPVTSSQTGTAGTTGTGGGSGAGAGGATADAAAGGCGSRDTTDAAVVEAGREISSACQACELGADPSVVPSCDPAFLSAMKDQTGTPVGWGVETLATAAERATGAALLRCLDVNDCAANAANTGAGDNAALGCFCGAGVAPFACIGSGTVHGACVVEYEAAATATPGGPAACASLATFSSFVVTATSGSTGPIALVGNIKRCAVDARCTVCDGL
jgi:hypothetical protein